jgi:hypothetical protein
MSYRIAAEIEAELNLSPVGTVYRFAGLKHLHYEGDVSHAEFAATAAHLNSESPEGMAVWSRGRSADGRLVLAVHVFPAFKQHIDALAESDGIGINREYVTQRRSHERAYRQSITTRPNEDTNTVTGE